MNRYMKKSLEVKYPVITAYPRHAYNLAIIGTMENSSPWIFSNYLQLRCHTKSLHDKFIYADWFEFDSYNPMLDDNPLLYYQIIYRDLILKYRENIVDFTIEWINEGYYFCTHLNELHVPNTRAYQFRDFPHSNLIFGYDKDQSNFDIAYFDKDGKLAFGKIGFEDYSNAFHTLEVSQDYLKYNYLVKPRDIFEFKYDIKMNLQSFKDYINGSRPVDLHYDRYRMFGMDVKEFDFGMDVYANLITYTTYLETSDIVYDIRPFHILFEHKSCLKNHLLYMKKLNLLENYELLENMMGEVEDKTKKLRNLFLKIAFFHLQTEITDLKGIEKIRERLINLKDVEVAFFESLIEQLSKSVRV
ncbi:hypothetical protein [Chengkuizengella marina]|uniref:Butirosin biosynthesis protein H, N-terminal n=1 Tax=Chengkuizengella marina TaxID=2507566 RepID=A0A6N9PYV3_9BACL|nr:hypothetical protein [Chengkuizengella marina]NBI27603.1 hypothetical protein [Chengkuizengella marina]